MQPLDGALHLTTALAERGVDLGALGAAYLAMLATVVATGMAFLAARSYLVISPNRSARDYAIYVSVVLTTVLIAMILENELLPPHMAMLQYAAVPQLVLLLLIHLTLARRQEPWLVALGAASIAGTVAVTAIAGVATGLVHLAHWLTLLLLTGLLAFLWIKSVSTKRGFMTAKSIYVGSKENIDGQIARQTPWLGLPQWVALGGASVLLAILNSMLRGSGLAQIPVVDVAIESALLLVVTAIVCGVPAVSYWLARKTWMPELTRFAWLVWLVVSFAFTYGNYLGTLSPA
jgi:hypothetical protein